MKFKVEKLLAVESEISALKQSQKDLLKTEYEKIEQQGIEFVKVKTMQKKIYEIKHRVDSKALITLVDSEAKVQFYVREVPNVAWDVIELSTKPTTIIYDGARNLAANLLAEDGSVGIRITKEPFSKQLCFRMKRAIVSTSANISGEPSPHKFRDISDEILDAVDYVCTSRRSEKSNPPASSIIKLGAGGLVKVIRR